MMKSPEQWQADALQQLIPFENNVLMLCCRGAGKSEVAAAAAYLEGALGGFAMIVSRSDKQALETFDKVLKYHRELGLAETVRDPTMHRLNFLGGGRVQALPCSPNTIVGYHQVSLLILDEAAKIKDELYALVTPMLTRAKGRMALLSTPWGKRGFFWKEWNGEARKGWRRHRYTWRDCPWMSEAMLRQEEASHGPLYVRQEYECEFLEATGEMPLDPDKFRALIDPNVEACETW